ncbi:ornithine cyclodeaminase family protein [Kaustia mangrovi]|nr:ornithine cyclodeaminase family protein [Kaustia mangrovi]
MDADTVHRLLDFPGLVDALAEAHRGPEPLVERADLARDTGGETPDSFLIRPAWQPGVACGAKLTTVMPGNPARHPDVPAIQALYAIFDGETGSPRATIDGTALTYRKTAADSALGARLLAREDARRLVMVGAGALAPYLVAAHRAVRPSLAHVSIWNRSRQKAADLAEDLASAGVEADVVDDLEAAVRDGDVVCCATAATAPVVMGAWLKPGAHLDLVGGFTPSMRECDDEAVRRASLFVDSRWFAVEQAGDIGDPLRRGVIGPEAVRADLFELCRGLHPGRDGPNEITLFKNGGGGHLDLFTAIHAMEMFAREG